MRRTELDQVLTTILASQPEVSDVLFTVDRPPQVEAYGELKPVVLDPPIDRLTPFQIETIAMNIIGDNVARLVAPPPIKGTYVPAERLTEQQKAAAARG